MDIVIFKALEEFSNILWVFLHFMKANQTWIVLHTAIMVLTLTHFHIAIKQEQICQK